MAWLFKRKSSSNLDEEKPVVLQAAHNFVPTQVTGDTEETPSLHTLPTLAKLLTVKFDEKFALPENKAVVWVLVTRNVAKTIDETTADAEEDEEVQPKWGFIPKSCLTDESIGFLDNKSSLFSKIEQSKQENALTALKLTKTEKELEEALEKNKELSEKLEQYEEEHLRITANMHQLIEQLVEKGNVIDELQQTIDELNEAVKKEQDNVSDLEEKLESLSALESPRSPRFDSSEAELNFNNNSMDASIEELKEHLNRSAGTPISDLMLSCTLCQEKISIQEMESHSSKCSSDNRNKNGKKISQGITPGMLVATVTNLHPDATTPSFKIICKTTIEEYKKPIITCERTLDDLSWLRSSLESLHPERVIPPLSFQQKQNEANLREIQRFLSRLCAHKTFKSDSLVRNFFCATNKELEKLRSSFAKQCPSFLPNKKPAVEVTDKEGLLFRTQVYIGKLIVNLESIVNYLKTNNDSSFIDGLGKSFLALSNNEPNETYLKTISKGLSNIINDLENKKNIIYDEGMFVEDLESILGYVKSVDDLLRRIERSINTFLYWDEEVKVFEEMKSEGFLTLSNGIDITHKWAEASSNSRTAKEELELMCRDLSDELIAFDLRKEQELKQIFIEYAQSRCDTFGKFQSKWYGVKLMMDSDIVPDVRSLDFKA